MSFGKDPIIERKMELDRNPAGTHLKVAQQREREKTARMTVIMNVMRRSLQKVF